MPQKKKEEEIEDEPAAMETAIFKAPADEPKETYTQKISIKAPPKPVETLASYKTRIQGHVKAAPTLGGTPTAAQIGEFIATYQMWLETLSKISE